MGAVGVFLTVSSLEKLDRACRTSTMTSSSCSTSRRDLLVGAMAAMLKAAS